MNKLSSLACVMCISFSSSSFFFFFVECLAGCRCIDVQFPLRQSEAFCELHRFQKGGNGFVLQGQTVPFVALLGDNDDGMM